MQGVVGLLQAHTLLLVLLQSQRVDGEKGHVGLEEESKQKDDYDVNNNGITAHVFKSLEVKVNGVYMCNTVFGRLV